MKTVQHFALVRRALHQIDISHGKYLCDIPYHSLTYEAQHELNRAAAEFIGLTPVYQEGKWWLIDSDQQLHSADDALS